MSNIVELKNISKSFSTSRKISVLNNLSYKFKTGKIYSLMGPSGSGKSTFIRYLLKSLAIKANQDFHFLGSPTYQREHHYNLKKLNLIHFDFYQVDQKTHVDLEDYFMNNCLLIEWPLEDLKKRYLPDAMLIKINIKEQKRIIEISSPNSKWLP